MGSVYLIVCLFTSLRDTSLQINNNNNNNNNNNEQMDQRTRKLMTIHKALHPRDDVDRLYVSRIKGGRGLTSSEDIVDVSIQQFEDYIQKHGGRLITATRNNSNNIRTNRTTINRKQ